MTAALLQRRYLEVRHKAERLQLGSGGLVTLYLRKKNSSAQVVGIDTGVTTDKMAKNAGHKFTVEEIAGEAERYRTLLEINNAIITNLTQEELLSKVFAAVQRLIPFDKVAISLYEPERDGYRILAQEGPLQLKHFFVGQVIGHQEHYVSNEFDFERPLLLPDLQAKRQNELEESLNADGVRSFCAVPLRVHGTLLGALSVASKTTEQYAKADAKFLQEVGNQIALALANMKSYEEIKALSAKEAAAAERRRTLLEINNAIIAKLTQEDLFRAVFSALQCAIPFAKVGLTFYEPESDGLRFFALEGESSDHFAIGKILDRRNCCFGEAFDTQRPVLRRDLETERVYVTDDYLFSEGIRSYCTVPLIAQGKSIGAMSVVSETRDQYSEADAEFLQEVANQVALAVANMKSYEEIAALKVRLQAENVSLQETAALMGRFAAALSHELNSPLGALKSAVQSSQALAVQKATSPPEKQQAETMEAQLRRTIADSVDRLHQVVLRMQRFTNLDRTQVLAVDLNSLLQDVVDLLESQTKGRVRLELDLKPLPRIVVRPQQMSSVFLNLLQNALEESNGSERVLLASRQTDSHVQVIVQDDGKGMSSEEVTRLFDPAFKVKAGWVSTGNWSLFSSRQIIQEHGGQIEIQSSVGKGTLVRVALPC